jgi:hypothetical protein
MGSGSALVAAARLGRRYAGYDLDPAYVEIAERRVKEALAETHEEDSRNPERMPAETAGALAEAALVGAGFAIEHRNRRIRGTGVSVPLVAVDKSGATWLFEVGGPNTSRRGGLTKSETVWRTLGRAAALRGRIGAAERIVVLTTCLPETPAGDSALRAAGPGLLFDVVDLLSRDGLDRLKSYATESPERPLTGFWREADLGRL